MTVAADFHAGGIAAKANRLRSRCRNRAAHAPEFHTSGGINESILAQMLEKTNYNTFGWRRVPGRCGLPAAFDTGKTLRVPAAFLG